ncbi:hypothetical protein EX895_006228 [Sporisorium graminicola]|uniref:Uncharacterized protein n=1 Tax=Sporisorium graminicola TaxID=280036 RepID=A0A4U7KPR4_9BASI|nr:hypothetical protein EX895_006228 [Sporisorium graminicola]TKY85148.1 hypothetical protein EX895_006228 [Sporisorium graminicola]
MPADGTALERLELSSLLMPSDRLFQVYDDGESPSQHTKEAALAAHAVASLITDPQRCRSLYALSLEGNDFGHRGVRIIVSAFIGSGCRDDGTISAGPQSSLAKLQQDPFYQTVFHAKSRRPNRSLTHLGLSGNVERGWRSVDPEKEIERLVAIKRRYAPIPSQDIEVVVSFLHHRARQQRLQGNAVIDDEAPIEVTRHLATLGVTMDEWQAEFQEAFEIGSGLNRTNWQDLLVEHLRENSLENEQCRSSAFFVLTAARTLGCRAKRQTDAPPTNASEVSAAAAGFPRFLDLPPELRLHVLRQLDNNASLSARQFSHVISFACDPSTIGYGRYEYSWSHILDGGLDSVGNREGRSSATLPARPWSWAECFALRAPPRDWEADLLDADHFFRHKHRGTSKSEDRDASAHAFLESTLTHRPE